MSDKHEAPPTKGVVLFKSPRIMFGASDVLADLKWWAQSYSKHSPAAEPDTLFTTVEAEPLILAASKDQGHYLGQCLHGCGAWATDAVPHMTLWVTTDGQAINCAHALDPGTGAVISDRIVGKRPLAKVIRLRRQIRRELRHDSVP